MELDIKNKSQYKGYSKSSKIHPEGVRQSEVSRKC